MKLNWWQKVLVFILSILVIPFLIVTLVVEVIISVSGSASGDAAAIIAWVFGLPIGIILAIIFPFILVPLLEKIKLPDKEQIELSLKSIWRFWSILALIVLADIAWAVFAALFVPWILGSGWAARDWIYKEFRADTYEQHIAIFNAIGVATHLGTWLIVAINFILLISIGWLRKSDQHTR